MNLLNNAFSFSFFFIGLNTAFFIFREAFLPLRVVYTLCVLYIAIRALYLLISRKESFSKSVLLGKYFIYVFSLLLSIGFSVAFFLQNVLSSIAILLLAIAFLKKANLKEYNSFFLGYKISLVINFIYAGIELLLLLVFNVQINQFLFFALNITDVTNVAEFGRISGLIWDPFLLGIFCATSFFIFKSKIAKIYILVILFFSGSRSGQVGFLIALIYYYYPLFINERKVILAFLIVFLVIPFLPAFIENTRFFDITNATISEGEMRRREYYTFIPKIWASDENPLRFFLGGAPLYTGARFYYANVDSVTRRTIARNDWAIESDWSGILLGRGIIGFLYYLYIFLMIILNQKCRILTAMSIAILFSGIGYNYSLAIFINFILFFASSFHLRLENKNLKSEVVQ